MLRCHNRHIMSHVPETKLIAIVFTTVFYGLVFTLLSPREKVPVQEGIKMLVRFCWAVLTGEWGLRFLY